VYPDGDPDHRINLISCSLAHCQLSTKISCKCVPKFLCQVLTDRQANNDDYVGGGNYHKLSYYSSPFYPSRKSYALQWAIHSPKNAPSCGNICTPSNMWFGGSTRLSIPDSILISSAVFAQLKLEGPYTL